MCIGGLGRGSTVLASINYPVTIDGGGQVILDGSLLGMNSGLAAYTNGGGSTIQGLTICKFGEWGVLLADNVGGSLVQNNILRENGNGVHASTAAHGNTIAHNTIVLNTGNGIYLASNNNVAPYISIYKIGPAPQRVYLPSVLR